MEHLAQLPYVMWQNQFNLFDSHDVPRLHNNPKIHPEEYRGAVMLLFTLIGAANIYYGDEASSDGEIDTNENCRYPMPWDKDYKDSDTYKLYSTLAHMKAEHKALSEGGMKFLYAKDDIVAIARFYENEVYVAVVSTNEETQKIVLPVGSVGGNMTGDSKDVFGRELNYTKLDERNIELTVEAHQSYFIDCTIR